nr:immunoglobulin heavy chain junction region [Macaca mulatta]
CARVKGVILVYFDFW